MASYHGRDMMGVSQRKKLIRNIKKCIQAHLSTNGIKKKDVFLVGSGCSGVAMASVLSHSLGVRWGFIRKKNDTIHHPSIDGKETKEHKSTDYTIFVDDFVSHGVTARYVYENLPFHAVAVGHCGSCSDVNWISRQVDLPGVAVITPPGGEG